MKNICILAAAIAIAASPALAQSGRKAQAQRLPEVPSSDPYGPHKRYKSRPQHPVRDDAAAAVAQGGMTRAYWAPPQGGRPDEPRNCRSET
jgi:hypothetical protein